MFFSLSVFLRTRRDRKKMAVFNAKSALLLASLAAAGCLTPVESYSGGAPTEVCEDMLPQHGAPAQTKDSPYTLTPNRKSVRAGESITLTLAAKDLSKFKGFMVQARDNADNPIGSFAPLPASKNNNEFKGKWKLISCPKGPANVSVTLSARAQPAVGRVYFIRDDYLHPVTI